MGAGRLIPRAHDFGESAEGRAAAYLTRKGFRILTKNYRCPSGEIDIVALDGKTVVFVEVKARRSEMFGGPEMAVDDRKQRRISRAALTYLSAHRALDRLCRFDILSIREEPAKAVRIDHLQNAFSARLE